MNLLLLSGSFHSTKFDASEAIKYFDNYSYDTPFLDNLPYFSEDLNHDKPPAFRIFYPLLNTVQASSLITPV